jgi:hypothetical protein
LSVESGGKVAAQAVIADGPRKMIDLEVVGHQQPALHREMW